MPGQGVFLEQATGRAQVEVGRRRPVVLEEPTVEFWIANGGEGPLRVGHGVEPTEPHDALAEAERGETGDRRVGRIGDLDGPAAEVETVEYGDLEKSNSFVPSDFKAM